MNGTPTIKWDPASMPDRDEAFFDRVSKGWNEFWFTPRSPKILGMLRIPTGLLLMMAVASFTPELWQWFGADGILPASTTAKIAAGDAGTVGTLPSYWFAFATPSAMQVVHYAGLLIVALFTLGWRTRWTSIGALIVLLSYVHRAPMITSQFESVLTYLVAYLCLGPAGAYYSLDRWLAKSRGTEALAACSRPTVAASISLRLIQLHTAALYAVIGLTKLAGAPWWNGEASWWLIAQTESRLVDWTSLRDWVYLVNAWTHAWVVYELAFPLAIWRTPLRVPFLGVGIMWWLLMASVTGLVAYALAMIVASLAFAPVRSPDSGEVSLAPIRVP